MNIVDNSIIRIYIDREYTGVYKDGYVYFNKDECNCDIRRGWHPIAYIRQLPGLTRIVAKMTDKHNGFIEEVIIYQNTFDRIMVYTAFILILIAIAFLIKQYYFCGECCDTTI